MNTATAAASDTSTQTPDNAERAKRIEMLLDRYQESFGDIGDDVRDATFLASVLADVRHWCDANSVDFQRATTLANEHYEAELDEAASDAPSNAPGMAP
jgi:hypothetical protein